MRFISVNGVGLNCAILANAICKGAKYMLNEAVLSDKERKAFLMNRIKTVVMYHGIY